MNLFETLIAQSTDVDSLDQYLASNLYKVQDFYSRDFMYMIESREIIEQYINTKYGLFEQLDLEESYNRAFLLILLDISVRFNFIANAKRLCSILRKKSVELPLRLQAACLYLENIDSNTTLLERFESICESLQNAIEEEEKNPDKAIAIFLSYYAIVVRDTHPHKKYINALQSKIQTALEERTFLFFCTLNM